MQIVLGTATPMAMYADPFGSVEGSCDAPPSTMAATDGMWDCDDTSADNNPKLRTSAATRWTTIAMASWTMSATLSPMKAIGLDNFAFTTDSA